MAFNEANKSIFFGRWESDYKDTYFVENLRKFASDSIDGSENDDDSYSECIEAIVRRCPSK